MDEFDVYETRKQVGKRIREIRMRQGLSIRGLARMIGTDHAYLSTIERGEANATITLYTRIANGLGIDTKELFDY